MGDERPIKSYQHEKPMNILLEFRQNLTKILSKFYQYYYQNPIRILSKTDQDLLKKPKSRQARINIVVHLLSRSFQSLLTIRSTHFRDSFNIFSDVLSGTDHHLIHIRSKPYQTPSRSCSNLIITLYSHDIKILSSSCHNIQLLSHSFQRPLKTSSKYARKYFNRLSVSYRIFF